MSTQPPWGNQPPAPHPPQYQPTPGYGAPQPGMMRCPKCPGTMRTYERNGIHIEQCDSCRGIFLDFGELESLLRLESQMAPQMGPQAGYPGPAWGSHGGHHYNKRGVGRLFFSS